MTEIPIEKDLEIIKRGLNSYPKVINPSDSLLDTLEYLASLPVAKKEYSVHQMKIEDALYDAQTFLRYYYKLRKVPYLHMSKVLGFNIHFIRQVNPLKLPINLIPSEDIFSGSVTEILPKGGKPHIIFREINLSQVVSEHTSASYVHEITHTQLDRLKGSIKEYYNLEVLSIFNELFHAAILDKEERMLRLNDSRRIHEMSVTAQELRDHHTGKSKMSRDELLDCCKYLVSGLKAYNLFITFYNANDELKNEILDDIQSVFDGYITLEELLLKYDITYESSQDKQKLTKYFSRWYHENNR